MLPPPPWLLPTQGTPPPPTGSEPGHRHHTPVALPCRLKTAMSTEAPTTRQLSEYLKHAKGRTRTAIRNGQVWEESLKRLRQKATQTNVTGTENPLGCPPIAGRGHPPTGEAEAPKSCVSY